MRSHINVGGPQTALIGSLTSGYRHVHGLPFCTIEMLRVCLNVYLGFHYFLLIQVKVKGNGIT